MYSPLNGKLPASSASTNILAALQRTNDAGGDAPSFSSMLQQTHRAPSREPASPPQAQASREPARNTQRTAERQPASTQARDESTARPEPSRDKSDVSAANGSGANAQAEADGTTETTDTTGETAEPAATPTDEVSTANAAADASTDPASLAELSAILAALAATHAALVPNGAAAPPDAEATDGQALATGEGLDATRAEIEAAIDKLPKELQAAARALVNLPAAAQQAGMEGANANAATADAAALEAADAAAKEAKPSAATSATTGAAQVTTVAQVGAAAQNQAPLAATAPAGGGELAAASALAQGARTGRSEAQAVQQLPVFTPAGHKAWSEDVGNRLIWMANRGESRAELVLTPPSLGKLGVSIQVSGDQTTAQFVAATPAAREALEQAMPRLRELLQQAGINLGQTDVSTSPEQQARDGQADGRGNPRRGGSDAVAAVEGLERPLSQVFGSGAIGLVDTFA